MIRVAPADLPISVFHQYLLGSVAPRPIAFASTIDENGNPNLSPFSFFNVFGSNPPIAIFSPARKGRGNTTKHTYENIKKIPEVVINVVNYDMVHQASLSSTEYPAGVNEFVKAGFTAIPSELIKPFRVKESPVQMECKVLEVKEMGTMGGAPNLIICEVILMHIHKSVLNAENKIDQNKIDLVGRLSGDWYCRASGSALFEVEKPLSKIGIGVDQIPEVIRNSHILTGNNLGQLGNVEKLPSAEEIVAFKESELFKQFLSSSEKNKLNLHSIAKKLLDEGKILDAWKVLLSA
ncbi:MAG TPA: flavin reductase family protein [Bacteroidia bacterium]|nr:flavin reductase family protein [Bacteroidia bacterium]